MEKTNKLWRIKNLNPLDIFAAIIVLSSLLFVPYNKYFWIVYSLGCFIYIYVNFKNKLYGATVMNIVASLIGIVNFFK